MHNMILSRILTILWLPETLYSKQSIYKLNKYCRFNLRQLPKSTPVYMIWAGYSIIDILLRRFFLNIDAR